MERHIVFTDVHDEYCTKLRVGGYTGRVYCTKIITLLKEEIMVLMD